MIEVFKTNIRDNSEAEDFVDLLLQHFPGNKINFDLEDCDKILRIEGKYFISEKVMKIVKENGFVCEILEE